MHPFDQSVLCKIIHYAGRIAAAEEHFFREFAQRHRSEMPETFQRGKLRAGQPECPDALVAIFVKRCERARKFNP
jgi:hypothetical protein